MKQADFYIKHLKLLPHPEGGFYKEVYRSDENINQEGLPQRYKGNRSFSTSIYFLLKGEQKSYLHKLKSDEAWHFYDGSPVRLFIINSEGKLSEIILGKDIENGEVFQYIIKKENWFCAEVVNKKSFSLIGCTVSPGLIFQISN